MDRGVRLGKFLKGSLPPRLGRRTLQEPISRKRSLRRIAIHAYPHASSLTPRLHTRRSELEKRLVADKTIADDQKARQLAQLGRTESSFLRLRRTRLGLDDFKTVKVIGKGAFGEVRPSLEMRAFGGQAADGSIWVRGAGATGAEGRYGQDLRDEKLEEG